jgi:hypothetical protein
MKIVKRVKDIFKDDEQMFKINTGLKFIGISIFFLTLALAFTYVMAKIDLNYFNSKGFPGVADFDDAFYGFVYSSVYSKLPLLILPFICIFIIGYYVAIIMMRPFKVISKYCEENMANHPIQYSPDLFSDLKLLTSFTTFFFSKIGEANVRNKFEKVEIPEVFTRIHKPVFEKNFFFNYFFLIIAFSLLASIGIFVLNLEIHNQVALISKNFLKNANNQEITMFLNYQFHVTKMVVEYLLGFHVLVYCLFGFHLYGQVSTPAFAVFATMRSFLKGNFHNRIHLVGYSYLRNDCRIINKYLEHVQKSIVNK